MSTNTESTNDSDDADYAASGRQPAVRVFAAELNNSTEIREKDPDDERSPKYVITPTGEKAGRVLIGGTVTEIEDIGEDSTYLRARIVDSSGGEDGENSNDGTFFVYAGQYQPEAVAALENIEPPEFVTVVGKPRTYTYEDEDTGEERTNVSVQPEFVATVGRSDRDRWVVETAEATLDRIKTFKSDEETAPAEEEARELYDLDTGILQGAVRSALHTATDDDPASATAETPDDE